MTSMRKIGNRHTATTGLIFAENGILFWGSALHKATMEKFMWRLHRDAKIQQQTVYHENITSESWKATKCVDVEP